MRTEMSAIEIAARLILGDHKAHRLTAHPVTIKGGTCYQLSHFGHGTGPRCKCCAGQNGSVTVETTSSGAVAVELNSRAYHDRVLLVFVLEPAAEPEMQPSERELVGDALVELTKQFQQL